jgi:hypothetical protein
MSLRSELEAMLEEFEHFAYDGAPLDTATEKVREILAKTAPKILTTVDELDSEEAKKALCLIPVNGSGAFGFYDRYDTENHWTCFGSDYFFSSATMIEEFFGGVSPGFMLVERQPESLVPVGPKVLTTLEELDSEEAFVALCIMPYGGPLRVATSRSYGVNSWMEPGSEAEYTSAELLAHFASIGAEAAFTLIPH